jgi:signal transduction histidine kinase
MGQRTWQRCLLFVLTGVFAILLIGQSFFASARWIHQPFPGFFVHENLTVGPYSLPGWTGPSAGLQSLDRILRVNGKEIEGRRQLYDLVRQAPVGDTVRYQVEREGHGVEFAVPTQSFSLRDWLFSFGVYSVIGMSFLVIGVTPYFFRASSPVALPLCFMVLTVFVWFQTTFDFMTEGLLPKEIRLLALSLTPSAAIHLALMLKSGASTAPVPAVQVACVYAVGVLLGTLNSVAFFGPPEIWLYAFRASYVYVFAGAVGFLALTGIALRRSESALDRSRLRVMFVGALLGFLLPALMTVLASSTRFHIAYNLALLPTVFFPISVAYALLKYRLFDLGNALRVGLSRVALLALLVAIYALVAFLLAPWIGEFGNDPLVPIFFSILVVALFNPLLRWLEGMVDRYIFRQEYDSAQVQQEISLYLRSLDTAASLAKGFVDRVTQRLGIENAFIVYRAKDSTIPFAEAAYSAVSGLEGMAANAVDLEAVWPAPDYCAVARTEVKNHPGYQGNRESVLMVFDRWQAELLLPLVYEQKVRGAVAFGPKQSGREYSAEDFRLLGTLADQLALALENARLFEESVDAYRRVEASNRKLVEMDRVKKDFVANICHELRTPVSTIIGYGEVLLDFDLSADARGILNRMIHNGQELSSLMDNLMNFSRVEADGSSAQVEPIELRELLRGLEMMTRRLIRQRPIEFGIRMDAAVETIESDGQKLQQILLELLTNAVKFTEKGKIELSIRSRGEPPADVLEIAIADTGIGIKTEDQKVIFEDFRQLDGTSTRRYGGTGVGLSLCRKLAEALGGEIHVASEAGGGSVFSLFLPMRTDEPATPAFMAHRESSLLL